jgi:hypothetical protein
VFRYLNQTPEFVIWYSTSYSLDLVGFSDADFAGVGLIERALLALAIFLDLLLYVYQLASRLLVHSPPQRLSK